MHRTLILTLFLALSACGDSKGGASPAPPSAAASPAVPTYVIVRVASTEVSVAKPRSRTSQSTLHVVDPAAPSKALLTVDLGSSDTGTGAPPNVATTQSFSVDRAARRFTYNGEALALFVKDGKVFKIELRSDLPHAPTQISSLTTACRISGQMEALRISADGRDAWVMIDTPGATGSCTPGSTGSAFVRSTMPASAPPLAALPGTFVDSLDDGAQGALGFLMSAPTGLALVRPDFTRVASVEGAAGVQSIEPMGYDYATLQAAYYRVDGTLRRLSWTATSATLAAPTYTFARADFGQRNATGHSDAGAFYFADDNKLLKVAGAGQPAVIATVAGPPIYAIFVADTHLVLWQADPANPMLPPSATVIGKGGGAVFNVTNARALGASASRMVYVSGPRIRAVKFDGTGDAVLAESTALGSVVYGRSRVADQHFIDGVVACVPGTASDAKCSNGRIVQTSADSLAPIEIGAVTHAQTYGFGNFSFGGATFGRLFPAAMSVPTFAGYRVVLPRDASGATRSTTDLYTWTPGAAGSLVRLTSQVP